jgi:hypothetical protein
MTSLPRCKPRSAPYTHRPLTPASLLTAPLPTPPQDGRGYVEGLTHERVNSYIKSLTGGALDPASLPPLPETPSPPLDALPEGGQSEAPTPPPPTPQPAGESRGNGSGLWNPKAPRLIESRSLSFQPGSSRADQVSYCGCAPRLMASFIGLRSCQRGFRWCVRRRWWARRRPSSRAWASTGTPPHTTWKPSR